MRNPGVLIEMSDGRKCIAYKKQPLLKEKGKVIVHLLDEDLKILNDDRHNCSNERNEKT